MRANAPHAPQRTLSFIPKDAFVMEYGAERLSPGRSEERLKDDPNIETYIMETGQHGKGARA